MGNHSAYCFKLKAMNLNALNRIEISKASLNLDLLVAPILDYFTYSFYEFDWLEFCS